MPVLQGKHSCKGLKEGSLDRLLAVAACWDGTEGRKCMHALKPTRMVALELHLHLVVQATGQSRIRSVFQSRLSV